MPFRAFHRRLAALAFVAALGACHRYEGVVYRVEAGDNLQALAEKFQLPPDALLRANPRMKYFPVKPGEKILVPQKISRAYIPKTRDRYVPVAEKYPDPGFSDAPAAEEGPPPAVDTPSAPIAARPGVALPAAKLPPLAKKPPVPVIAAAPAKPAAKRTARARELRFLWPAKGKVISKYGKKDQKMHNGIDIKIAPSGEVRAAEDGKVVFCGNELDGYGNLIILRHRPKIYSVYAYLGSVGVKKGDEVAQGQTIAKAGATASDSFFHFEIRNGKQALDPLKHLP